MKVVLLSGGGGTRLFPLSRESYPKQFLKIGGESFIQKAFRRALALTSKDEIAVSTNERYAFIVKEHLGDARLIEEPVARNTTAAFIYAIKVGVEEFGWDIRDVFAFLPTDHEISPDDAFAEDLRTASDEAEKGRIVVIGVPPKAPKTGFGYIKASGNGKVREVESFVEKPSEEKARRMLNEGGYFWNSGIYVGRGDVILDELVRVSPEFSPFVEMGVEELKKRFSEVSSIAIDYSLAEKTDRLSMVVADFSWNDVGSWDALYEVSPKNGEGNVVSKDALVMDAKRCLVFSEDTIPILIGVEDLVVVESKDVLLVAKRGETQRVRDAVKLLKERGFKEAVEHKRVYRPWGYYEVLLVGDRFKVKKVHVKPGRRLSLQMHHHRAEHWVVVRGTAKVILGDREVFVHENESVYVPKSTLHRIENVGKIPLEIVEVQTGEYVEEDDIIRVEDDWGRKEGV